MGRPSHKSGAAKTDSIGTASESVSVRGSGKKIFPSNTCVGDLGNACANHPSRHMLKNTSSCGHASVARRGNCGHVMTTVSSANSAVTLANRTSMLSRLFQTDPDHLHQAKRVARCGETLSKSIVERHVAAIVDGFGEVHQDR